MNEDRDSVDLNVEDCSSCLAEPTGKNEGSIAGKVRRSA